jgi:hypothetical protein
MRNPASRVPKEYIPETMDRLQLRSEIKESIKTETEYVCPGPEKNRMSAETPTMIQP